MADVSVIVLRLCHVDRHEGTAGIHLRLETRRKDDGSLCEEIGVVESPVVKWQVLSADEHRQGPTDEESQPDEVPHTDSLP